MFSLISSSAGDGDDGRAGVLELSAAHASAQALRSALRFSLAVAAETLHNGGGEDASSGTDQGDSQTAVSSPPTRSWRALFTGIFLKMHKHSDAIFTFWHVAAEARALGLIGRNSREGGFAGVFESLFGLSRDGGKRPKSLSRSGPFQPLSRKQRWASLFQLALLPALHLRLQALFSASLREHAAPSLGAALRALLFGERDWDGERTAPGAGTSLSHRLLPLFVRLWPLIELVSQGLATAFLLAFMHGRTEFYSPGLWLFGTRVRRETLQEARVRNSSATATASTRNVRGVRGLLVGATSRIAAVLDQTKLILPVVVFTVRFLEWWHNEAGMQDVIRSAAISRGVPPPPTPPEQPPSGGRTTAALGNDDDEELPAVLPPSDPAICALCKRRRTNDAATPAGFVFCYPCLFSHVQARQRCPISLIPMEVAHIRKIYDG
jgi:peroxin-12